MKFRELFEGDVVRMNPYMKTDSAAPENAPKESGDWKHPVGWGTHADKAAWSSQAAKYEHEKSKPELNAVDKLSAGGNMVPGSPTQGLHNRVSWAVSSPDLFSGKERTILDHHMKAHGFEPSEGSGKTTQTSGNAWKALSQGTRTTKEVRAFRSNTTSGGHHHFVDVTKDEDGFRWSHFSNKEKYGARGHGMKVRGQGSDYSSLESHLAKHWPDRDEGGTGWDRYKPRKVKYSSGKVKE